LDNTLPSTVLTGEWLQNKHVSLAQALDQQAGLRVQQLSGFGSTATLAIRGSTAEQVSVYLDDTPLVTVDGSALDLADIPLGQVQALEVYRGGTPAWLGSQAVGGTLRIALRDVATNAMEGQLAVGAYGARTAESTASWNRPDPTGSGRWQATGGVRWLQADGNYPYVNSNGTAYDASDDRAAQRQNNAVQRLAATALVRRVSQTGESLSLRWLGHTLNQGLPGMALYATDKATLQNHRQLLVAQWRGKQRLWAERLTVLASGQLGGTGVDDRLGELGAQVHLDQTVRGGTAQVVWESQRWQHRVVQGHLLLRVQALAASISGRELLGAPTATPTMQRAQMGAGLAVPLQVGAWSVQPSASLDVLRDKRLAMDRFPFAWEEVVADTNVPWSTRVGNRLALGKRQALLASWSQGIRPPTLVELFGNTATVVGSPRLQSESAQTLDVGWETQVSALSRPHRLQLHGFWTQSQNLIQLVQQSPHRAQYQNIAAARLLGAELAWFGRWPLGLGSQIQATWLQAVDTSADLSRNGNKLPMRPGQRVTARLDGRQRTAAGLVEPWLALQWQSRYHLDAANLAQVPARTLVGAGLRWQLGQTGLWLDGRLDNLTDTRVFDAIGYPLPGRTWLVSLGWDGANHG
jgi:iron complex outermembrane receptor protein